MSVLLIRLDKIGDLVCSLPVDQILKTPSSWIIAEGLEPIAAAALPLRQAQTLSLKLEQRWSSFRQLLRILKTQKPKAVVIFYAPWWVSLACYLSRVPLRVGRWSQWHSFLFFNRGVRQVRTEASKHEADYNLELLRQGLPEFCQNTDEAAPILKLQAGSASVLLLRLRLQARQFVVIHPGMFGSALNWPTDNYAALIEKLTATTTVVITGTPSDARFLEPLRGRFQNHSQVRWTVGDLHLNELLSLLSVANALLAPSTGVLHLAASLGVKSIGIYSPVQVHHPRRWGPRGPQVQVHLPNVSCPGKLRCLGPSCAEYDCMSKISVEQVLQDLT